MEETNLPIIEQKESIKLMKMSKGFQWEIKLLPFEELDKINPKQLNITDIDRLEGLNNEMKKRFGVTNEPE